MFGALTFLLTGCLLQGALCGYWKVNVPRTIKVLRGSCVTIPCSFDIDSKHENDLDRTCRAIWKKNKEVVFDSSENNQNKGKLKGILTDKDCTTTLNMVSERSSSYYFRLECNNALKYNFDWPTVWISVEDKLPPLALTPSTLKVNEGTSVSLTCSAPAPCLTHPPTLTWTPNLGESQETLQENQDKTKVQTSVLNFTASHPHHGQKISCTAVYRKQDGSSYTAPERSLTADVSYSPQNTTVSVSPSGPVPENRNVTLTCSSDANPAARIYTWFRADGDQETLIGTGSVLKMTATKVSNVFFCKAENERGVGRSDKRKIDVPYPPQILPSSDCTKSQSQVLCSCQTVGNPSPTLRWYLDGLPVNQSSKFTVITETLNDTSLKSNITVNQPQQRDLSALLCHSFNSVGSASKQFCVSSLQISAEKQEKIPLPVFITVVAVLVIVCILLFVTRFQRNQYKHQLTGEVNTASGQHPSERNEASSTAEGDIYANHIELRQADVPLPASVSELNSSSRKTSGADDAEGAGGSSGTNGREDDVIYSRVTWKTKSMKNGRKDSKLYLEEEKCEAGDVCRKIASDTLAMESLYADVKPGNSRKRVESVYAQVHFKD